MDPPLSRPLILLSSGGRMRPCTYTCCFFGGRDLVDGWVVFWLLTCVCWVPFEDMFLNSFPWCDSPGRGHWVLLPTIPLPPPPLYLVPSVEEEGFFLCVASLWWICHWEFASGDLALKRRSTMILGPWADWRTVETCAVVSQCTVAVKLVWEQRKPVCGSRVKWAVFCWASVFERS